MIYFNSDYTEGAHPRILQRLIDTNLEQTPGYGTDGYCRQAADRIKEACGRQDIDVHFLMGGTQTNLTVTSAALRPHQGVISALTGHISCHESGAIEATGHKVLGLICPDGKLTAAQIRDVAAEHWQDENHEHAVQPKMVYISDSTELGTIYSRAELEAISQACRENDLILYLDGARLGYALAAPGNDLDLPAIANLCDAFYIGGTKVGALFGEALVITRQDLKADFRYLIKQKGGMLAKGRLLGLQFLTLFEDGLYFEISKSAVSLAMQIKAACQKKGYPFLIESVTNQQFPIIPDTSLAIIAQEFTYSFWLRVDENHSAVRFCTSWATKEADVQRLISCIETI